MPHEMGVFKRAFLTLLGSLLFLIFSPLGYVHYFFQRLAIRPGISSAPISGIAELYANVLTTAEEALRVLLPGASEVEEQVQTLTEDMRRDLEERAGLRLDPVGDRVFRFFVAKRGGETLAYAAEDVVPGKWGPIHYMIALDPQGIVQDVIVLEYQEKRGRPVAKRRFLKQFVGKSVKNDIKLMKDIRGVTGATISSRGMADGIRKIVYLFQVFYGNS